MEEQDDPPSGPTLAELRRDQIFQQRLRIQQLSRNGDSELLKRANGDLQAIMDAQGDYDRLQMKRRSK